jgi:hypothetical protein
MKKCTVCLIGTWIVGLSALAWGVLGVTGGLSTLPVWARVMMGVVGVVGLGFLFYQPPMKPCPRCVAANRTLPP